MHVRRLDVSRATGIRIFIQVAEATRLPESLIHSCFESV